MTTQAMQTQNQTGGGNVERTRARPVFVPRADIFETAEAIVLKADVPGVKESSLSITLEDNVLTLEGNVEPEHRPGFSLAHAEYDVGDYRRVFTLSTDVDRDKIEATLKAGVLTLTLPKAEPAKARKIAVRGL